MSDVSFSPMADLGEHAGFQCFWADPDRFAKPGFYMRIGGQDRLMWEPDSDVAGTSVGLGPAGAVGARHERRAGCRAVERRECRLQAAMSAVRYVVQTFERELGGKLVPGSRHPVADEVAAHAMANDLSSTGIAVLAFTIEDDAIRTATVLALHGEVPKAFVDGLLDYPLGSLSRASSL